jgi:hypothetical protein
MKLKNIFITYLKRNSCFLIVIILLSTSLIAIQLTKQPRPSYTTDLFKLNYNNRNYFVDNYEDYEFDIGKKNSKNQTSNIDDQMTMNHNVIVFNLSQPLLPSVLYESIQCTDSMIYIVKTTLCVHDVKVDMHVSGTILSRGAWEQHILSIYICILSFQILFLIILFLTYF